MQLSDGGEYSLAIHHDEETLKAWGLSPEMIGDQKGRAWGPAAVVKEEFLWFDDFFEDEAAIG